MVRHEDLSMNPADTARRIYEFIGKTPPSRKLLDWLLYATRSTEGSRFEKFQRIRFAVDVVLEWREWYGFAEMKVVQEVCAEAIRALNYTSFDVASDLRDLSILSF